MREKTVQATLENLDEVMAFVEEQMEVYHCSMKMQMQIAVAVEEIYVNIASYAYREQKEMHGSGFRAEENRCRLLLPLRMMASHIIHF